MTDFIALEEVMDSSVGQPVEIVLERGGNECSSTVRVQDLHAITPCCFLQAFGGIVHALSYQQARNFRVEVGKVYVAETGFMLGKAGVSNHCIITSVNKVSTPDVETFAQQINQLP
eukprot:gene32242-40810_t